MNLQHGVTSRIIDYGGSPDSWQWRGGWWGVGAEEGGGILQPLMPHNCNGVTVEMQGE